MGRYYSHRWKPSKTAIREFAQKMDEIDDFVAKNGISQSANSDSYYFTINGKDYRVSNHSVEASNRGAYDQFGNQRRMLYHPGGRDKDTIYIHAGKTRIKDIYNDLMAGWELDGKGYRKNSPEKIAARKKMTGTAIHKWIPDELKGHFKGVKMGDLKDALFDAYWRYSENGYDPAEYSYPLQEAYGKLRKKYRNLPELKSSDWRVKR